MSIYMCLFILKGEAFLKGKYAFSASVTFRRLLSDISGLKFIVLIRIKYCFWMNAFTHPKTSLYQFERNLRVYFFSHHYLYAIIILIHFDRKFRNAPQILLLTISDDAWMLTAEIPTLGLPASVSSMIVLYGLIVNTFDCKHDLIFIVRMLRYLTGQYFPCREHRRSKRFNEIITIELFNYFL